MRVPSIDLFRVLAIFAVILIHTRPFDSYRDGIEQYLFVFINQGARFAVPFFFTVAGYLWGKKIRAGARLDEQFIAYSGRIALIFLVWSAVYLCLPDPAAIKAHGVLGLITAPVSRLSVLLESPVTLLFQGTKGHLWFLTALLCALALTTASLRLNLKNGTLYIACALYVFGLLAGSYAHTPIGLPIGFNTRNGPFLSMLFFVIGWILAGRREPVSARVAITLIVAGLALHMTEVFMLWRFYDIAPSQHDYVLGTLPFGVGVVLLALALPALGQNAAVTRLGPHVLGVYVIHVAFIAYTPRPAFIFDHPLGQLLFPALVGILSFTAVILLARLQALKKFIR